MGEVRKKTVSVCSTTRLGAKKDESIISLASGTVSGTVKQMGHLTLLTFGPLTTSFSFKIVAWNTTFKYLIQCGIRTRNAQIAIVMNTGLNDGQQEVQNIFWDRWLVFLVLRQPFQSYTHWPSLEMIAICLQTKTFRDDIYLLELTIVIKKHSC